MPEVLIELTPRDDYFARYNSFFGGTSIRTKPRCDWWVMTELQLGDIHRKSLRKKKTVQVELFPFSTRVRRDDVMVEWKDETTRLIGAKTDDLMT